MKRFSVAIVTVVSPNRPFIATQDFYDLTRKHWHKSALSTMSTASCDRMEVGSQPDMDSPLSDDEITEGMHKYVSSSVHLCQHPAL